MVLHFAFSVGKSESLWFRLGWFLHRPVVPLFHIVSLFTQGVKMVTGNILLGLALRLTSEVY